VNRLLLAGLIAIAAAPAAANTPDWSLREYVQTTWTHRNGLPLAPLGELTQTTDGYLWFVADRGQTLVRFDGVQFSRFGVPCDETLNSLVADRDGGLWMLCRDEEYKLFRRQTGRPITRVPLTDVSLTLGQPATLWVDSRGHLWVIGDVIARRQPDGSFQTFPSVTGRGRTVAEDASGVVWVSDGQNVVRLGADTAESTTGRRVFGSPVFGVHAGDAHGIYRLAGGDFSLIARAPTGIRFNNQRAIDSSGAIWAGTEQHGVARIKDGRVETALSPHDVGSVVSEVFIDREDDIWVASAAGLHRYRKPHARLLPLLGGHVPSKPLMVWVDPQNDVWVGNSERVIHTNSKSGHARTFEVPRPIALAQDSEGNVFLGASEQLFRLDSGRFRPVVDVAGAPIPRVRQIVADASGYLWGIAETVGIYQLTPGPPRLVVSLPLAAADLLVSPRLGTWASLGGINNDLIHIPPKGEATTHRLFADQFITSVMRIAERGDSLWVGHTRGLSRWRNGQWTTWTRAHGLPGRGGVQELINDELGRVWLLSDLGVLAVSAAELDATPDGAPTPLRFLRIGELDRVVPHPGNLTTSPRASKDRSGRLYFATLDSVAVVDPASVSESSVRPTISLESVLVDGEAIDASAPGQLTMPSKIQFDYTSLSLRSPETIRFRYKLEGHDQDWTEAGGARQASYGTLPAGTYRFRVIGSGSEDVWNEEGASFAFTIVPLFYNTWWFRVAALLLLTVTIAGAHRLRVRRLTDRLQLEFEARLSERTRIAQELHDTLLQGTLAASLHAQLADQALQKAPTSPAVEDVRAPVRQVVDLLARVAADSRAVLSNLRSEPGDADIAQALHQAACEQSNSGDIEFRLVVHGAARPLKPMIAEEVIRIAREAVVNAYRHSNARLIAADLIYQRDGFQCVVRDDGDGMTASVLEHGRDGHWGLAGMRERAERAGGQLRLRSSATAGTEVELSLPGPAAYAAG
jgi:signal transduction histidine kinase/ligand-binding sensor domain-containing protein